jgi:diguanylate cyclase (GGDEF)-like protein
MAPGFPTTMADRLERRKQHQGLMERIDQQNWHLWMVSFCITICLALAIASFFYPAIRWHVDRLEVLYGILPQLIMGLLTLVLLCVIYIVLKQRELNELRKFLIATDLEAQRLRQELPRDALTGSLDRRALPDVLKREVRWVDRYRVPLSLLLFNVRGFRAINASEGNLVGDEVLKSLAASIEATARQTDTILRYGPDRFLCFLPRTDPKGARAFARRVIEACQRNPRLRDLCLSFGIAEYHPGSGPEKLLADVDGALARTGGAASHPPATQVLVQPH